MKREITFRPAFDKRNTDPKKDYGIHGVDMLWVLKGYHGAVQFIVYTGWQIDGIQDSQVCPADLGYHSKKPMYHGQEPMTNKCAHLGGKKCYYDGSGLAAEELFRTLKTKGSDGVWAELEQYYIRVFGVLK